MPKDYMERIRKLSDEEIQSAMDGNGDGWEPEAYEAIQVIAQEREAERKRLAEVAITEKADDEVRLGSPATVRDIEHLRKELTESIGDKVDKHLEVIRGRLGLLVLLFVYIPVMLFLFFLVSSLLKTN
jgi:hypothetical protein